MRLGSALTGKLLLGRTVNRVWLGKEVVLSRALEKPPFSHGVGKHHKTTAERKKKTPHWPFSERGRLPLGSVPATCPGVRLDP